MYRYFIGREDQSINESVAISRIDQQLVVTRIMMHAYHLNDDIACVKLRNYMCNHFTLMMAVCSVYSRMSDKPDAMANLQALWDELKAYDEYMYKRARRGAFGVATNLPTKAGVKTTIYIYRIAQSCISLIRVRAARCRPALTILSRVLLLALPLACR